MNEVNDVTEVHDDDIEPVIMTNLNFLNNNLQLIVSKSFKALYSNA